MSEKYIDMILCNIHIEEQGNMCKEVWKFYKRWFGIVNHTEHIDKYNDELSNLKVKYKNNAFAQDFIKAVDVELFRGA